ncbi:MAG: N-acetylneuraminate synthase family protein [Pseudomonadota bacterium]
MGVFVIAEIGINHNGDIRLAKLLIDMAKDCGCDAVKFQKRAIDVVYSPEFLACPRQSPWGSTQREQKEGLELGKDDYDQIDSYCREKDIDWFASAWDTQSQVFLRQYKSTHNKIASAMLTHIPLLRMVAEEGKHTFMSTGMSTYEHIDRAVGVFRDAACPFTLMHCVSTYPCADEDCNVSMIRNLKERYGCDAGYSGHEVGLLPSVLAVAQGATAIERHITLDRAMYGSDQAASLERRGLELLVRDARMVSTVMGNGNKYLVDGELKRQKTLRYFREE